MKQIRDSDLLELYSQGLTNREIAETYIKAYSGGRGIHIHIFFGLSSHQKRLCDGTDVMPKDVRVFLFEYILRHAEISPKLIGPGKTFDTACVNWSDEGKGHLIRVFGGKKQKYKTLLSDIPEERPKTNEVVFPDDLKVWKIPDGIFQEFIDHFKKSQKERIEVTKRYHTASENFTGTYLSLSCVQKILEGLPEGQRNNGAHVLAIACRLDRVSKEEACKVMLTYKGNCSEENITESEYLGWVNWIYTQEETIYPNSHHIMTSLSLISLSLFTTNAYKNSSQHAMHNSSFE